MSRVEERSLECECGGVASENGELEVTLVTT